MGDIIVRTEVCKPNGDKLGCTQQLLSDNRGGDSTGSTIIQDKDEILMISYHTTVNIQIIKHKGIEVEQRNDCPPGMVYLLNGEFVKRNPRRTSTLTEIEETK